MKVYVILRVEIKEVKTNFKKLIDYLYYQENSFQKNFTIKRV